MKLAAIWNARDAWNRLGALKKQPKLAYQLMKYERTVAVELETCEAQRNKLVYEVSGAEPGTLVNIEPGTPEFAVFWEKFNAFLANESDLKPVPLSMEVLIEALDAEKGNAMSEADMMLLEPFFPEAVAL